MADELGEEALGALLDGLLAAASGEAASAGDAPAGLAELGGLCPPRRGGDAASAGDALLHPAVPKRRKLK